jgi:hypothetical protein
VDDIAAERLQTDYRAVSNRVHESEWEIALLNNKNEDVTVNLVEPLFAIGRSRVPLTRTKR